MAEPGYWGVTPTEATAFRGYLLKGGFVIFDDFRGGDWDNLQEQMRVVLPEAQWIQLDGTAKVFHSFFEIRSSGDAGAAVDYGGQLARRTGACSRTTIPTKRLMAIANVNNDISEYWEFSDTGVYIGRSHERGVQVRRELRDVWADALSAVRSRTRFHLLRRLS